MTKKHFKTGAGVHLNVQDKLYFPELKPALALIPFVTGHQQVLPIKTSFPMHTKATLHFTAPGTKRGFHYHIPDSQFHSPANIEVTTTE